MRMQLGRKINSIISNIWLIYNKVYDSNKFVSYISLSKLNSLSQTTQSFHSKIEKRNHYMICLKMYAFCINLYKIPINLDKL